MRVELKVPAVGESIAEVEIGAWKSAPGEPVTKDQPVVVLESEKATVDLPSPVTGVLTEQLKRKGEVAKVGEIIAILEEGKAPAPKAGKAAATPAPQPAAAAAAAAEASPRVMPAAQRLMAQEGIPLEQLQPSGPGGRVLKEDVLRQAESRSQPAVAHTENQAAAPEASAPAATRVQGGASDSQEVVPMSRLRRTIAERLVQAQRTAALLTTFNEIDMQAVISLRQELGDAFQAKHGVKLGFMSFFVKATVDALKLVPQVNAEVRDREIIYYKHCDIGVAIGGGKGLVVPVLRQAENMSFADMEKAIANYAALAKDNRLKPDDLQGGTFTISNGGVYGSLLSTPIVNPPQSGVLGMHAIQERPVAREGQVVIRPMMYVALTYDHRLVDGREAVTFLRRIKELVESPTRMLLGA
jgi:2-oxoglutarate dehydrogenase E2 component (dihydrolipoamide succinyltransferase)